MCALQDPRKEKAAALPQTPGVYVMRDREGKVVYVGKAKKLRNRVYQYFANANHPRKVANMVRAAADFEVILTDTELEALVLENQLIKKYKPKYNILLKDDKGFHYIRVSKPPYPLISAVKQLGDDGADYLGPYYSGFNVTRSVEAARKVFKLPSCALSGDKMGDPRRRPCLNYHIGLCSAPCAGKISRAAYEESVAAALRFLKEGSASTVAALTAEMEAAAEAMAFEKAARLRDCIRALREMTARQTVVEATVPEQDVVALARSADAACFEVFTFRGGKLCDREQFLLDPVDDPEEARGEFLRRYYSLEREVPPVIALDGPAADAGLLAEWLTAKRGRKVALTLPQRGEQKRLVDLCRRNAAEYLAEKKSRPGRQTAALDELTRLLGLKAPPDRIEAYDISHTGGDETVGAMIVYRAGAPDKSAYRKFKIRGFANDDLASMKQVLTRRFEEYEKGEDPSFAALPDLILLDGGEGQVAAVAPVLAERGLSLPLFGMVKDDHHKTRALTAGGSEIAVKPTRAAYMLVYGIQEEVHRFAIGYHRQRRKKKMLGSSLTAIPGVGETRARALMTHFGTVSAVRAAEIEDLMRVKGMTAPAARRVYEYFHGEDEG